MSKTFTCDCCGHIYLKGWTEEEAMSEFEHNFPDTSPSDTDFTVCDECQDFMYSRCHPLSGKEPSEQDKEDFAEYLQKKLADPNKDHTNE